jgi:hypothetical protein
MRTLNFARFAIFLALIALAPGCKDDDKDPSQFIGNYVIVQAELAEALLYQLMNPVTFLFPLVQILHWLYKLPF